MSKIEGSEPFLAQLLIRLFVGDQLASAVAGSDPRTDRFGDSRLLASVAIVEARDGG